MRIHHMIILTVLVSLLLLIGSCAGGGGGCACSGCGGDEDDDGEGEAENTPVVNIPPPPAARACEPGEEKECPFASDAEKNVCKGAVTVCECVDKGTDSYGNVIESCSFPTCDYSDYSPRYESDEKSCDGWDNDCNGDVDDVDPKLCAKQAGVCEGAVMECNNSRFPASCSALEYSKHSDKYEEKETLCDGLDNDCDGSVDEGLSKTCELEDGSKGRSFCIAGEYDECTTSFE